MEETVKQTKVNLSNVLESYSKMLNELLKEMKLIKVNSIEDSDILLEISSTILKLPLQFSKLIKMAK